MLVPIKFTKGWKGYNAGEVAGFDPALALDIVSSDVGIPLTLDEIQKVKDSEKAEDKEKVRKLRAERIKASRKLYRGLIDRLDPKRDKERIKALTDESEKIARLISEQRS
jgi:hypothetical protein